MLEIGAQDIPQLLVFNKLDEIPPAQQPGDLVDSYDLGGRVVPRVFVSALKSVGIASLRAKISEIVLAATASSSPVSEGN